MFAKDCNYKRYSFICQFRLPLFAFSVVLRRSVFLRSGFITRAKMLVHGQVTIIFVVSVCLSVCLFICAEFFSAVFDPISLKLGHKLMLYAWV